MTVGGATLFKTQENSENSFDRFVERVYLMKKMDEKSKVQGERMTTDTQGNYDWSKKSNDKQGLVSEKVYKVHCINNQFFGQAGGNNIYTAYTDVLNKDGKETVFRVRADMVTLLYRVTEEEAKNNVDLEADDYITFELKDWKQIQETLMETGAEYPIVKEDVITIRVQNEEKETEYRFIYSIIKRDDIENLQATDGSDNSKGTNISSSTETTIPTESPTNKETQVLADKPVNTGNSTTSPTPIPEQNATENPTEPPSTELLNQIRDINSRPQWEGKTLKNTLIIFVGSTDSNVQVSKIQAFLYYSNGEKKELKKEDKTLSNEKVRWIFSLPEQGVLESEFDHLEVVYTVMEGKVEKIYRENVEIKR